MTRALESPLPLREGQGEGKARDGTWRRGRHTLYRREELSPCGTACLLSPVMWWGCGGLGLPPPDLGDCLVTRPRPWQLIIWEPLRTKAPGPHLAIPYCCYSRSVIFYVRPWIQRPWKVIYRNAQGRPHASDAGYEAWDKIETRLVWDDLVRCEGELFEIGGGRVVWGTAHGRARRWWMCRAARRKQQQEKTAA